MKKPKQDIVRNAFLHSRSSSICFSVGLCGTGAHPPLSALHARQLHPPAQDCTLIGHQPQRPAHLVCPGWSLPHCVRLHQEPHHSHPVSQHNLSHTPESDKMQYIWRSKLKGIVCCFWGHFLTLIYLNASLYKMPVRKLQRPWEGDVKRCAAAYQMLVLFPPQLKVLISSFTPFGPDLDQNKTDAHEELIPGVNCAEF